MIFKGTKLPDEISIARDKGELVIFVGAGVSRPSPSNLPLFDGLVVEIGRRLSMTTVDVGKEWGAKVMAALPSLAVAFLLAKRLEVKRQ